MLPVRVKVFSSSSCTLSEASSLLQRFLSSDGCWDSFARNYVANVAQSLDESLSRRAGSFESSGKHPALSKLHPQGNFSKQSLAAAHELERYSEAARSANTGLAMAEPEFASKRHRKKRKHSSVGNDFDMVPPHLQEPAVNSPLEDPQKQDRKRRKKEKQDRETEDMGRENTVLDDQARHHKKERKIKQVSETEGLSNADTACGNETLHEKKRRKAKQDRDAENMLSLHVTEHQVFPVSPSAYVSLESKSSKKRRKEKVEVGESDANVVSEAGDCVTPLSLKVEEHGMSSSKKKRKKENLDVVATPHRISFPREKEEVEDASPSEFQTLDSGEIKKKKKKKRNEHDEF